jgi:hypothetical protein
MKHPYSPRSGDILMMRFPYDDNPGVPTNEAHPVIVMDVLQKAGQIQLCVCFGTSQHLADLWPGDFVIERANPGFVTTGLTRSTKFRLAKRCTVPFTPEWFIVPADSRYAGTPKIGKLTDELVLTLVKPALTQLHAHRHLQKR